VLLEKLDWHTTLQDPTLTLTICKIIESLKRGEECRIEIHRSFVPSEDLELKAQLGDDYDPSQTVWAHVKLHNMVKVEDWFKDGSTIVKTLRKGKGRTPFIDSTVKLRLQIKVNGEVVVNNFPEKALHLTEENKEPAEDFDFIYSENLKKVSEEERKKYLAKVDSELFTVRIDEYELPSLLIKVIKTMKKNGVTSVSTTRMDKMISNFANEKIGLD
jgi:hypothetical protein